MNLHKSHIGEAFVCNPEPRDLERWPDDGHFVCVCEWVCVYCCQSCVQVSKSTMYMARIKVGLLVMDSEKRR